MNNIYLDHLEQLRNIKKGSRPFLSLFVPLKWQDFPPSKILSALIKAADGLLIKSGHSKLEIRSPDWDRWMRQGTVTLGIFHHNGVTNFIPLSTKMPPRVVVAKSFHIKPIVTASQEYIDAVLLHFNEGGATLYRVNPVDETIIDRYRPSEMSHEMNWPSNLDHHSLMDFLDFLQHELKGAIQSTTKFLGITASSYPELRSETYWGRLKLPVVFCEDSFKSILPHTGLSIMRLRLSMLINERHALAVSKTLNEITLFQLDSVGTLVPKILNNEIKRLCVSLDCMYFGEVDPTTGNVRVNKAQQDAADDDLLDDLVELAIDKGIEVSVVPKKYLPQGRSFVAS